jgi:hypothetical protein
MMETCEKPVSDRQGQLFALLAGLSGHLQATSPQEERSIRSLQETLARVLPDEDISTVKSSFFSVENSDLFFTDTIAPQELQGLSDLAAQAVKEPRIADLRVFVRDLPVRSTQMKGSLPLWAGGAAPQTTVGPFLNKDGRKIWFDFYLIQKLVALYIDGRPDPAILFNVSLIKRFMVSTLPPVVDPLTRYQLLPDSVWLNSQILASNAPSGFFTGLKIKSGEIALSAPPQLVNGKLVLSPNTTVTVKLDLSQPAVTDADPTSPYGKDARSASLDLPQTISFHFSGAGGKIDGISGKPRWNVYGHKAAFQWNSQMAPRYDALLNRVLIPFSCSEKTFAIRSCQSPFNTFAGSADIQWSAWALPAGQIDVTKPSPAAGIGGIAIQCPKGLTAKWHGLQGGEINLGNPYVLAEGEGINFTDLQAGNLYCNQEYKLWKDDQNPFGSSVKLQFTDSFPYIFTTFVNGTEALLALTNANPLPDRPVRVSGEALDIHSKNSLLFLGVSKAFKLIYIYDDNILFDNYNPNQPKDTIPKPIALALHNALFKVTAVNGCLLFGELAEDMVKVGKGILFLTFGMYAYLPTLPDPYAANINRLKSQFAGAATLAGVASVGQSIWLWLVCEVQWGPGAEDKDQVDVSFHFAPLQGQFQVFPQAASQPSAQPALSSPAQLNLQNQPFVRLFQPVSTSVSTGTATQQVSAASTAPEMTAMMAVGQPPLPDYQALWDEHFSFLPDDVFALLDVSSNADQMGVSFAWFSEGRLAMMQTLAVVPAQAAASGQFPLQVEGLDVGARGAYVRAFTVPQISWEPVFNLTPPAPGIPGDPPAFLNYYPNDGGPTKILNNSVQFVPIAPIPVSDFIIDEFNTDPQNQTAAIFTLPFGLRAWAEMRKNSPFSPKPSLQQNAPAFENDLKGGIQVQANAGSAGKPKDSNMFQGYTLQMNNILAFNGAPTGASTLGDSVTRIFNDEFFQEPLKENTQRGVPLTRIDFSGYGASIFSNWLSPSAAIAQTSQARFDVFVGRCGHEVIQVRSILYPWGIRVVRTITLFRTGSAYVYRYDSGWRAESDGRFDFSYNIVGRDASNNKILVPKDSPYEIHPGVIKGLFNVKEIKETSSIQPFVSKMTIPTNGKYLNINGEEVVNTGSPFDKDVMLRAVYFNADAEIEGVVQGQVTAEGHKDGLIPSKGILGFVQLAPAGEPLTPVLFQQLLEYQLGSIGGPADCVLDIGKNGQHMRVNRFDVNASVSKSNTPVFAAAARGNVILPKDGSWSMVRHTNGTGEVTPLAENITVPLIRVGQLAKDLTIPDDQLLRVADPMDLLRDPVADTVNYGFLQSTDTQKALFLTPSFQKLLDEKLTGTLLSKTPPLFADAYRLVSSKGIFPNIGDAVSSFGDAITLAQTNFNPNTLITDAGKQVFQLMQINTKDALGKIEQEGYQLLKKVEDFDLPSTAWYLINEDYLKVYVEYKAQIQKQDKSKENRDGKLNFDVDSFAGNLADKWKSRLNNLAMVVDLGPFQRLLTIKGNFDAKKGSEASYVGDGSPDFPAPQLEFSKDLQPIIDILEILEDLQGEKYGDALKKGLKIAMSNSADSWEYKFEASKEIPVVKFPVPDFVYNDPNTPLKLEASMKVGVYFNAALKVTDLTDPKKLLPTAGASMDFYGRLSVMCVSLSAATVYAVGQVNLGIAADTKVGPSLKMKFGFGAQIVVGLPVVGNVSVLYMVGVEIYADSTKLNVSAFLLFKGHAEILGGLVSVTITIEAKGTISRSADRTDCAAMVTFGLDISIFLVIDISFSESWQEQRQIA